MQHRTRTLALLLLVIALLGVGWYFRTTLSPSETQSTSKAEPRTDDALFEVPVLTDTTRNISRPAERYTIAIAYPTVTLSNHPELAKEANQVIGSFIADVEKDFVAQTKELASPLVPETFSSDLTMHWKSLLVSPSIISLRFEYSAYVAGMAHPDSRTRILNYDLARHRLLAPTDLFASTTKALPFLSDFTRTALHAQFADEPEELFVSQALPGTEPTHENFQEIGIEKDGLIVIFNPYQVAPYARGTIQVSISLENLAGASGTPGLAFEVQEAIRLAEENFREAAEETPSNQ